MWVLCLTRAAASGSGPGAAVARATVAPGKARVLMIVSILFAAHTVTMAAA
jgi:hypothetical protein